ncbi:MAG: CvpA family protein [Myxococcota bacterium]
MTLDVFIAATFVLLTYLGWRTGVLRQVTRVLAAICVVVFTAPLSVVAREAAFPDAGLSLALDVAAMCAAGVVVYVSVSLIGWLIVRAVHHVSDTLGRMDRAGGMGVGALKALLVVYVAAVCVSWLKGPLKSIDPGDRLHMRDGEVLAFVERHDVLAPWRFPDVRQLHAAVRLGVWGQGKRGAHALRGQVEASDVLRHRALEALIADDTLCDAAANDIYPVTLADARVRSLLQDNAFVAALRSVDWVALEEELIP